MNAYEKIVEQYNNNVRSFNPGKDIVVSPTEFDELLAFGGEYLGWNIEPGNNVKLSFFEAKIIIHDPQLPSSNNGH